MPPGDRLDRPADRLRRRHRTQTPAAGPRAGGTVLTAPGPSSRAAGTGGQVEEGRLGGAPARERTARLETKPDDAVWYAAYGSNLDPDRFGSYLLGGRPPGATRTYPGTRAQVPALDTRPFTMPGRLVFAWHSPTWDGAIAFHDPTGDQQVLSTAYLLPPATFSDVLEQEMWRTPVVDHDLSEVLGTGRQVLGPGRYETLHLTGELDGRPVVTFSADDLSLLEPGEPAPAYLATMARGLRHAHGLGDDDIVDYVLSASGITLDRDAVLRAIA